MKKSSAKTSTPYEIGFEIVALAGDARTILLSVLKELQGYKKASSAQQKKILTSVTKQVKEAQGLLDECHVKQTGLLQAEAKGAKSEFTYLVVHAQDHLMTTILLNDLIETFISLLTDKK
ncbi:MAG: PTS lactose/cellobiose transporter subunit IIA [Mycoplasma sp.]